MQLKPERDHLTHGMMIQLWAEMQGPHGLQIYPPTILTAPFRVVRDDCVKVRLHLHPSSLRLCFVPPSFAATLDT